MVDNGNIHSTGNTNLEQQLAVFWANLREIQSLNRIMRQIEATNPPTASQEQIDAIVLMKITQVQIEMEQGCSICLEEFIFDEEAKVMPCKVRRNFGFVFLLFWICHPV